MGGWTGAETFVIEVNLVSVNSVNVTVMLLSNKPSRLVSDSVFILYHLVQGGVTPPPPGSGSGVPYVGSIMSLDWDQSVSDSVSQWVCLGPSGFRT